MCGTIIQDLSYLKHITPTMLCILYNWHLPMYSPHISVFFYVWSFYVNCRTFWEKKTICHKDKCGLADLHGQGLPHVYIVQTEMHIPSHSPFCMYFPKSNFHFNLHLQARTHNVKLDNNTFYHERHHISCLTSLFKVFQMKNAETDHLSSFWWVNLWYNYCKVRKWMLEYQICSLYSAFGQDCYEHVYLSCSLSTALFLYDCITYHRHMHYFY